ncbi:exodeoxyribonuclease VII small subunit [Paludibaculum fermentans]|uniref:Exodeoxyribonuclease 7 small subunit n=1 Tax=Paludibaculum fermentans TaxID=1473598 RepID=A0A7S7SJ86_PALFE|nr:exodeoxyribonuclease VII small subunit [Paludibaculum fermentans]QOY87817.1 exodeoxyribonuclease VII small subunit [Paludibaculum fermentans]
MADKKPKAAEKLPSADAQPFEQSISELEAVVRQLESAELPLEQALELFEKGMLLSDSCRKQLTAAETRVEILMKKGEDFEAVPFDPEEE